ncbi:MAG TPA: rhodanese-like domain-containing protein [Gaiellaceae bacterium]
MEIEVEEVARRLGEEGFVVLDTRSREEYTGQTVAPCDPRPGRIPGAAHLDVQELLTLSPEEVRERLGDPVRNELVTYCHSGSRSALAAEILRAHGYHAVNYRGSWHEWSRDESLPAETG